MLFGVIGAEEQPLPSVTDLFNGFSRISGDSFTGGPTTVLDYSGALITPPVNRMGIQGGRLVTNRVPSAGANLTTWAKANGGTGALPVVALDAASGMYRVQLNKGEGNTSSDYSNINLSITGQTAGRNQLLSFRAKSYDGATYKVMILEGSSGAFTTCEIGPVARRFYLNVKTTVSTACNFGIFLRGSLATYNTSLTADILISDPQYEDISGQTIKTADVVAAGSAVWFANVPDSPFKKTAAIGDSITYAGTYLNQIEQRFVPAVITNKGVGGNKLADMWARWNVDVLALAPSAVIIAGGVNDIGHADSDPLASMQATLDSMVQSAKTNNIVPVVLNVSPFGGNVQWTAQRQIWLEAWNTSLVGYCAAQGIVLIDIYTPLKASDSVRLAADYDNGDGLHLNGNGHIAMGAAVAAALPLPTEIPLWPSQSIRTRKGVVAKYGAAFKGFLNEPARTNKLTCRKHNPTDLTNVAKTGDAAAILSVVDDSAALTAAGLNGICTNGKVYKLDNSAGTSLATAFDSGSTVGNVNAHSISAYVRGTGTGEIGLTLQTRQVINLTGAYTRAIHANVVPSSTTKQFVILANPGAVVYFILPQLEEGAFATSVIPGDTLATVTRAATVYQRPTAGVLSANDWGFWFRLNPLAAGQSAAYVLGFYVDSNNLGGVYVDPTAVFFFKRVAGVTTSISIPYTHSTTPFEGQVWQSSQYGMGIRVKPDDGVWSAPVVKNDAAGKSDALALTSYQIGGRTVSASAQFAAYYPFIAPILHPDPKAELERLAARYPTT